jgi:pantothenate kinase-related protein Tda10
MTNPDARSELEKKIDDIHMRSIRLALAGVADPSLGKDALDAIMQAVDSYVLERRDKYEQPHIQDRD